MNRYDLLNEMATYYEAQARMFSKNCSNITAREGYEVPFEEAKDKVQLIRGMMKDARFGGGIMEPRQMLETLRALQCCRETPKRCEECPLSNQKKRRYNCIDFSKDMAISALSQLIKNRTGESPAAPGYPAGRHEAPPARYETQPAVLPLMKWQEEQMELDRQREGLL